MNIIGVDARPLSYGLTGNSRYLFEVLKIIQQKEKKFQIVLFSNKTIHPEFEKWVFENKIHLIVNKKIPGIIWLNLFIPLLCRKYNIQIFWGTLQLLPLFSFHCPMVVNYHDLNFISAKETMTKLNYLQHKILSKFTLKNAKKIFCLSLTTKNDIIHYLPEVEQKCIVIYPGITKFKKLQKLDKIPRKFLFTLGTLEPRKNLKSVLTAYLHLRETNKRYPFSLVIAARLGWNEPKLTSILKEGKYFSKGVIFVENPNDLELAYLYKNCSYFIFPSIHEGFGLPLLEAISECKNCVASNISVFREILNEKYDIFVDPKNVFEWEKALISLPEIKLKKRIQKNQFFWSWEKTALSIAKEIKLILI